MTKVALCYIVKYSEDELGHLSKSLQSVAGYVDGIFVNLNYKPVRDKKGRVFEPTKEARDQKKLLEKKYGLHIIETEWEDNFSKARNDNFAQVPAEYEWILWLDTDDTLDHAEKVKKVADLSERYDSVYVDYLYDMDEALNPLTVHMVARLVKNNGSHTWKGRIHETLVENRSLSQGATKDFVVIHHADEARKDASLARNVTLLEKQIEDEKDDPDPRTFYYLASTYMDTGDLESAKQLFTGYLEMSGWDQERSAAETKLGTIFLDQGDRAEAKRHFMLAIGEDPNNPEPRVNIGSLEIELKQYHKAQVWLEGVESMEKNMSTLERNPMSYTFRTYLLLAECYLQMGGKWLEKALEYGKKALKYKSKDKQVKAYVKMIGNIVKDRSLMVNVLELVQTLKKNKEDDKIKLLAQAVPKQLEDNQIIVKLREDSPYVWPEKSIAIMTGDTMIDEWGPWSLQEGIGGSEEAIIRLSKHLKDQGYQVVVFGKVGPNAGLHDGVMWRNFWECNLDDQFDIFIAWRSPYLFDKKINARKSYLWLHDVMEPGEFTPERIANFTKCIVLSEYHRSLFPMIPDEKILLSANGIDSDELEDFDDVEFKRDPHKLVWTSSHVRGLVYLYKIWPDVKKAVPDATLDVFYGRESYDAVHKGNPERMKWMDDLQALGKSLEGVEDHGRAGQDELTRRIFEAGIWAYPCPFPEISCITAMKMQAGGAIPVSSDFGALGETVQFGTKIKLPQKKEDTPVGDVDTKFLDKFQEKLIWWLQHPGEQNKIRPEMMKWARNNFDWSNVSKQWAEEFEA